MSSARGISRSPDAALRWMAHRKLDREIGRLRAKGTPVVRFEPGPRTMDVMGVNAMATDRSDRVVQAAFLESGRLAATGTVADRLRPIVSRPGRLQARA